MKLHKEIIIRIFCLSLLVGFSTFTLLGQQYFKENWKKTFEGNAYYIVTPSAENPQGEFIVERTSGWKRPEAKGIYKTQDLKTGRLIFFRENGDTSEVVNYTNRKKDGFATYYFPSGNMSAKYLYKEGNIISEEFWNEDGSVQPDKVGANTPPDYYRGIEFFSSDISRMLRYPEDAKMKNIEGRVVLSFIVDYDAKITDVKIVESVYPSLDKEAAEAIKNCGKWIPGKQHNQYVKMRFSIPVIFQLPAKKEENMFKSYL